uniref:Macrocin-O-methyltransferase (TylF)-like protein n=1 Tax=uncultured bacterium CSL1 TaxID=1091565 RepID=G4WVB6_9BACT|nr:macrocin-O-methyltransferase (TylF)-like protein [uncultured bacterium CSL1]
MLVTDFHFKSVMYRIVIAAFQLISIGQYHPYRERQRRALHNSVDYIEGRMPDALGFETQKQMIAYALRQVQVPGHYLEFGVFRGQSIRYMAKRVKPGVTLHGFDSFEGLPEAWAGFGLDSSAFSRQGRLPKVPANVRLYKGWFSQTLPGWVAANPGPVAFVHIDCDIYSSTVDLLEALAGCFQPGTIVLFDEYFNYPNWERHEFKAWKEFVHKYNVSYEYLAYARHQVAVRVTSIG